MSMDRDSSEECCEESQALLDDDSLCNDLESHSTRIPPTAPSLILFPALNFIIYLSLVIGDLVIADFRNEFWAVQMLTWVLPTDLANSQCFNDFSL